MVRGWRICSALKRKGSRGVNSRPPVPTRRLLRKQSQVIHGGAQWKVER